MAWDGLVDVGGTVRLQGRQLSSAKIGVVTKDGAKC